MKVYVTRHAVKRRTIFHERPDCDELQRAVHRRRTNRVYVEKLGLRPHERCRL